MKDDNAYNFRVIDYGDSVQVRLYSTPVVRGGQVSIVILLISANAT